MIVPSVSKLNSNFQLKSPANRFAESPCPAPSACHDQSDGQDDQSGDQSCDGIFLLKINIIPIIQNSPVEKRTEKLSTKQPCVYCFVACPIFKYIQIYSNPYDNLCLYPSSPIFSQKNPKSHRTFQSLHFFQSSLPWFHWFHWFHSSPVEGSGSTGATSCETSEGSKGSTGSEGSSWHCWGSSGSKASKKVRPKMVQDGRIGGKSDEKVMKYDEI